MVDVSKNVRALDGVSKFIIIEFERLLLPGARLLYEVLDEVLKAKKFAFNENTFKRFFHNNTIKHNIQHLFFALDQNNPAIDKLVQQITENYLKKIANYTGKFPEALIEFIKSALSAKWRILLVSKLPKDNVLSCISKIDYMKQCEIHTLEDINTPYVFTTKRQWQNILQANKIAQPKSVLALSDNDFSIKTAIAIGLNTLAIPNEYTVHQDFIGADIIVEDSYMPSLQDCEKLLTPVEFL